MSIFDSITECMSTLHLYVRLMLERELFKENAQSQKTFG